MESPTRTCLATLALHVRHPRWRLMACVTTLSTHFGSTLSRQASYYRCGFPAWISDWRAKSTAPHTRGLAFLYVQLAPHESGSFAWSFDRVSESKTQVMVVDRRPERAG